MTKTHEEPLTELGEALRAADAEARSAPDLAAYRAAAARQFSLTHAWLNEIRVQAHLARLDVQQDVLALMAQAEETFGAARARLTDEADERIEPLRKAVAEMLAQVSERAASMAERLRAS